MPNNTDIHIPGHEQHIPTTGSLDRNPLSGYEGVLERAERDKAMARKVLDGREPLTKSSATSRC